MVIERKRRIKDKRGYYSVYRPSHPSASKRGYILEHRLVMAEKLGLKFLDPKFDVHHLDGNKGNNHPDNLMLVSRRDHLRFHRGDWKLVDGQWFKRCPNCKQFLRVNTDYFLNKKGKRKGGPVYLCKKCTLERNRLWMREWRKRQGGG